jgi:hypothetical protein
MEKEKDISEILEFVRLLREEICKGCEGKKLPLLETGESCDRNPEFQVQCLMRDIRRVHEVVRGLRDVISKVYNLEPSEL